MRWEERAALQAAQQIEAHEQAQQQAKLRRQVVGIRETLFKALPVARDGGLSATELSDAWAIPRHMIIDKTDEIHRERKYNG